MATLGKAVIEFSADTATFVGDVGKAAAVFNKQMATMERGIESLRNAFIALSALGGAGALIKSTIDTADQLNKLSQRTALSVERLSELRFAAQLSDVGMDEFAKSMGKFNLAMVEARDPTSKMSMLMQALGVDVTQGPAVALKQFAASIASMADGEVKVAAMRAAFGKTGETLIPMMNNLDGATESARKLGQVMSADLARQSEQLNDDLKKLSAGAGALGIMITGQVIGPLGTMAKNMADAAESGNKWLGVMREIAKLAAALSASAPGWFGSMMQGPADKLFQDDERRRTALAAAGSSGVRESRTPVVDMEKTACILSGGKWVGEKCVRESAGKGGKDRDPMIDLAMSLQKEREVLDEARVLGAKYELAQQEIRDKEAEGLQRMKDGYIALADPLQKFRVQLDEIQMLRAKGLLSANQAFEAEWKVNEAMDKEFESMNNLGKKLKENDSWARELGLTFTSAFEEAVAGGKKLGDVLKSLAMDIGKLIMRETITKPLGSAVTDSLKGLGGGSGIVDWAKKLFSGGTSSGGEGTPYLGMYAQGTNAVPRDGFAFLHEGEAVVPASQNGGGGGAVVNLYQNFGSDVDRGTLMAWGQQVQASTLQAVRQLGVRGVR